MRDGVRVLRELPRVPVFPAESQVSPVQAGSGVPYSGIPASQAADSGSAASGFQQEPPRYSVTQDVPERIPPEGDAVPEESDSVQPDSVSREHSADGAPDSDAAQAGIPESGVCAAPDGLPD